MRYVRVRQGDDELLAGQGHAQDGARGPVRGRSRRSPGRDLVGWRYAGPFDDLPAVRDGLRRGDRDDPPTPYEHRVVAWTEVGEDEGTGIVHIAPGCGAEDFQLGKALGLPVVAPLDESGIFLDGFGSLSGRDVRDVAEPIVEHLKREGRFYRLETDRPPLPALLALQHAARLPPRRRVVHQHGPALRPAARDADARSRSTPACATRSWTSSTRSAGSRTSATSASSTGSATCTTG